MNNYQFLIKGLSEYVLPERLETFKRILNNRTRYITVVLEDIYQSQNASAVLRSCEVFGIQDIHVIEKRNEFDINPDITLGSDQWLSLKKYQSHENNSINAIFELRAKGYRIVATTPHTNDVELPGFNIDSGPVALFFGTERQGLSKAVLENADEFLKIPMMGFTESLNISVSAAIALYTLTQRLRNSTVKWQLSEEEFEVLLFEWLRTSIKLSRPIIQKLCDEAGIDALPYLKHKSWKK
jgi:tRNA (guanosine-2'-O-)-methyltransferase